MAEHKVTFLPNDETLTVEHGANLLAAAMAAGVHINASCGGGGVCGKCRVILENGALDAVRSHKISAEDWEEGYRQACESKVVGDVTIRIPVESQMDARALNKPKPSANASRTALEIGADRLKAEGKFSPPHVKLAIQVDAPSRGDNVSDLSRIIGALKKQHNLSRVDVEFPLIRQLPHVLREGEFTATLTLAFPPAHVEEPDCARISLIHIQPGDHAAANYAIAVDVGTTTVYCQFINLTTGEVIDTQADFNRQLSYGEDVITRIIYSQKEGGLARMQELVVDTINDCVRILCRRAKCQLDEVSLMTCAGNTTMTQLLLGIDPKYIRLSPYVPTANFFPPVRALDLGLEQADHVMLHAFPSVSSYVGGDIVAGIIASQMYTDERLTLYIDLGTNGEIVVGNSEWMACAACSAGPAFEGGGVKFGMRASAGAIEDFAINPTTFEPMIMTVDMQKPKGICGTGLINTVAALFEAGVIDANGKFNQNLDTDRVREGEDGFEYLMAEEEATQVGQDIVLTEVDIDNLIRAKAAMYAGYLTLLEAVGMSVGDLERVIIAGGFGRFINMEKAIMIGLLPEMDLERFTFIGNGSLIGARLSALSNHLRQDVKKVVNMITNFELSEEPGYMNQYVAAQFLPHTTKQFFPHTLARVEETKKLAGR